MAGIATGALIGGGLKAVGGLAQMASGIFGKKKRQREIENMIAMRPKYEIPKEVGQDVAMNRNLVNARLDGQQELLDQLNTENQNQINTARSSSGSLEDLLAVSTAGNAGMNESLIKAQQQGAAQREKRRENFSESLSNLSSFRDQAFKLNELDPYNQKVEMTMANNAASRQMTFGGLNQLASGGADIGSALAS